MTQKYYHARLMPAQAAQAVIDSLEFARTGQQLSGSLAVPALIRLRDSLFDQAGEIRYKLRGGHDSRQRPVLMLEVAGVLRLQCQRCLGPLDFPLRLSNTLLLVTGAADDSVDELESIEAAPVLDVAALVEDEIMLGLPYAPRHAEDGCAGGAQSGAGSRDAGAFAKLAALKRRDN